MLLKRYLFIIIITIMYKNLLSPETVSWEQFDYCKGLQHVLQPLSSSFAKT